MENPETGGFQISQELIQHLATEVFKSVGMMLPTFGSTMIKGTDGNVNVALPFNGTIDKAAYEALPAEQRNKGVWMIRTGERPLEGLRIEEYDTVVDSCDWHVRKWSNGYVELLGSKTYTGLKFEEAWGNAYLQTIGRVSLPFTLTKKYTEEAGMTDINKGGCWIFNTNTGKASNPLTATLPIGVARPAAATVDLDVKITWHITGRWKEETSPSTLETSQLLTSVVTPPTSGSTEVNGEQVNWEIPGGVDSVGSAAGSMAGTIGSVASAAGSAASFMEAPGSSAKEV